MFPFPCWPSGLCRCVWWPTGTNPWTLSCLDVSKTRRTFTCPSTVSITFRIGLLFVFWHPSLITQHPISLYMGVRICMSSCYRRASVGGRFFCVHDFLLVNRVSLTLQWVVHKSIFPLNTPPPHDEWWGFKIKIKGWWWKGDIRTIQPRKSFECWVKTTSDVPTGSEVTYGDTNGTVVECRERFIHRWPGKQRKDVLTWRWIRTSGGLRFWRDMYGGGRLLWSSNEINGSRIMYLQCHTMEHHHTTTTYTPTRTTDSRIQQSG